MVLSSAPLAPPGSKAVSPPPCPLRTAHATCTARRSSITNAQEGARSQDRDERTAQGPCISMQARACPWPLVTRGSPLSTGPMCRFVTISRPVTPAGSLHPCGSGRRLHPYPYHDSTAFAFSRIFYLHSHFPSLRTDDSWVPKRALQAYHVPRVRQTDRVRTPLYTGWVYECVGSPFIRTYLPTMPFWRWGRMVALAPPASRCVTPRLHLRCPYRPFPKVPLACHSPSVRLPSA